MHGQAAFRLAHDDVTELIDFLEPVEAFVQLAPRMEPLPGPTFDTDALPHGDEPLAVVPAAP